MDNSPGRGKQKRTDFCACCVHAVGRHCRPIRDGLLLHQTTEWCQSRRRAHQCYCVYSRQLRLMTCPSWHPCRPSVEPFLQVVDPVDLPRAILRASSSVSNSIVHQVHAILKLFFVPWIIVPKHPCALPQNPCRPPPVGKYLRPAVLGAVRSAAIGAADLTVKSSGRAAEAEFKGSSTSVVTRQPQ